MDSNGVGAGELLRVLAMLALVVVMILGLALALRRWQGERPLAPSVFRVLASIAVGSKEKILLLQVGDEQLVIGLSQAGGLRTLHTLQEKLVLQPVGGSASPSVQRFADVLRAIGRGG